MLSGTFPGHSGNVGLRRFSGIEGAETTAWFRSDVKHPGRQDGPDEHPGNSEVSTGGRKLFLPRQGRFGSTANFHRSDVSGMPPRMSPRTAQRTVNAVDSTVKPRALVGSRPVSSRIWRSR